MTNHYKMSGVHEKIYEQDYVYLNSERKYGNIVYQNFGKADLIFFNRFWPIFFRAYKPDDKQKDKDNQSNYKTLLSGHVYFIRNTLNIDYVLGEAFHEFNVNMWQTWKETKINRFSINYIPENKTTNQAFNGSKTSINNHCRLLRYDKKDLGYVPEESKQLDRLAFPIEVTSNIELARRWLNNRQWYESRGISWKTGWLLHGETGTGKSALARAIASDLNLPIFVYRLSQTTSQQFVDAWQDMQKSSPCVALFEDFDNIFDGRNNISGLKDSIKPSMNLLSRDSPDDRIVTELTFDTFLNALDGVERYDGMFVIITTNDLSKIDDALKYRPGRIDKVIELTYLTNECKLQMAQTILGDNLVLYNEMVENIKRNPSENVTGAQFQEKCSSMALNDFMKG